MDNTVKARILLAEGRGRTNCGGLSSYHTLNFGGHNTAGREPFGELAALNADVLAPACSTEISTPSPAEIYLIPVAGGLGLSMWDGDGGQEMYVSTGGIARVMVTAAARLKISNPYPAQQVSFFQLWTVPAQTGPVQSCFTLDAAFDIGSKNRLQHLFNSFSGATSVGIGRYDLRTKGVLRCSERLSNLLVYVIKGAFEFQDRLLQQNDALRIEDVTGDIDFEALSQDAAMLLVRQK